MSVSRASAGERRTALIAGSLMAFTFVTAIAALALYLRFSLPEIAFEASFAIYLIAKGFRPSPVLTGAPVRLPA